MNKNKDFTRIKVYSLVLCVLSIINQGVFSTVIAQSEGRLFQPRYELSLKIAELKVCNLVTGICELQKTDDRITFLIEFGKKTARGQVGFIATNETQRRKSVGGRATLFNGETDFFIPYQYDLEEPDGIFTYQVDLECIGNLLSKKRRITGACFSDVETTINGIPSAISINGPFEALVTKRQPASAFK